MKKDDNPTRQDHSGPDPTVSSSRGTGPDRRQRAEEALKKSEAKLRDALDAAPFPVAIVDLRDDNIEFWSLSAQNLFGHTAPTAAEWYQIAYPDPAYRQEVINRWKPFLETARSSGQVVNTGEYQVTCSNGSVCICELYAAFLNENLIVTFNDVTGRKRAEDALRKSEEKFRDLVEDINDIFFTLDKEGRFTYISPAVQAVLGYSPEEFMARPLGKYIYPEDRPSLIAAFHNVLSGAQRPNEYRVFKKSGEICWIRSSSKPIVVNGVLTGIKGIATDITEQKLAQESLRQSEETHRALVQGMPDIVMRFDRAGRHLFVSDNVHGMSDLRAAQFIGKTHRELGFPETLCQSWEEAIQRLFDGGAAFETEFTLEGKKGLIIFNSRLVPEYDGQGLVTSVLSISRDITAHKQAETEKIKLEGQLQQAQKMESVGRLAGGVAHDFNNMLGIILGHAELAMDRMDPAQPLFADLMEIRKAAERSANLTQQLLAFARKQTVSPKIIDLNETVEGMLKMLRRLIGEDIDLAWLPGAGMWPIKMDVSQIDQIMVNLCVNARDAITDVGRITIETGNRRLDEAFCANQEGLAPGEYALLSVSDNGCGMGKDILDKLFEPFFTTKEIGKGTGLGLATVFGIIKQNNGFINVYSELNHGTTFNIYLPRYVGKTRQMQAEAMAAPIAQGHETILIAEDDSAILEITTIMLEQQGYRVLSANTPGEAIRLAREYADQIHLLVTDVVMPEMNGRDLAKNLLSLYPRMKRLFMSGYTADVIAHHGVLDPGVYFIQKPFRKKDLAAKVREALDSE